MFRHHKKILLFAAFMTVIAGVMAARLKIDSDLRALLPVDHPVVRSLEKIESTFGSTNSVNVLAKGGTAEQRHAFTDALEERLEGHPLFRDVEHGLRGRFFAERALFYLSDAEMDELEERIDAWTHYKLCSAEPDACLTAPDETAPTKLREFIEDKRSQSYERTGFRDRYEREGIEAEVMLVHPYEPANQLDTAVEVTAEIRTVAKEVFDEPGAWTGGEMTYNILGPYVTKADEQATVRRDMASSGLIAFIGVIAILYFLFRSHRAVLVLLVPLMCGVTWSLAATQLVLGHLNAMTSTISTVVMGVGIDAGIHFFSRAKRARVDHDDGEAIRRAFDGLVVPLLVASSTTIGAFASMASSDFPAFREFGIIAALGVGLCLLSMVTVLPALCYLVGIKKRIPRRSVHEYSWATRAVLARPGLLFLGLVVLGFVGLQLSRSVEFEYNGRELQSDRARVYGEPDAKLISKIFGKDIHASVLVRPTYEEARDTLALARTRHEERKAKGDSVVAELFGVSDLMPDASIDMQARAQRVKGLSSEHDDMLDALRERAGLPPRERTPDEDEGDGGDWDEPEDWDDEGDDESESESADAKDTAPSGDVEVGDDWDDWDGSDDDEDDAPADDDAAKGSAPETPAADGATKTPAAEGDASKSDATEKKAEPAAAEAPAPKKAEPAATEAPAPKKAEGEGDDELSKEDAALMLAMLEAEPFTVEDLPPKLLNKVRASNGSYGLFAYPDFDVADMRQGMVFMDETSSYLEDPSEGIFVGEAVVYAAMYLMLREEAPVVLGMAAVLIGVLVFWQLRSIPLMLMTLVPLILAMVWLLGVMASIDMRFTLFNLPILPAILGIGVDNGVYLTDRIRRAVESNDSLANALQETGGAILAATATTAVGFAAFMVADSGGVRSIGSLAVLGIVLAAMGALLVLPTLTALFWQGRRARQRARS
ncbi:MAG: MMPL family transporter [Myxococcota bacterium]